MLASSAILCALILGLVAPTAAPARLVRSTSGPAGSVQGKRYVVDDPRTVFIAGKDRQVVVFFEWEAVPGSHHCEASWRDPSGRVVLISPADYEAKAARFGAFWSLALPESPTVGLWAVETTVDGEPAGTHTFQVSQAADAGVTRRAIVSPKQAYAQILGATVTLEALGAQGERLWTGSGFYVDDHHLVTAFRVIEGASSLRMVLTGGPKVDASQVVVADRRQDWAVLRTAPAEVKPLALAAKASVSVGDRGVFVDISSDGSRTLQEVSVVGRRERPGAGPRLNLSAGASPEAVGSPLINDYGEAAAIMGGALLPGVGLGSPASSYVPGQGPMAVPIDALPDLASLKDETFAVGDLLARGLAARPVTRGASVLYGILGRGEPTPQRGLTWASELSHRDGAATVQLTWDATQQQEGAVVFQVFDVDNHMLMASRPTKVKVRVGQLLLSVWKLPLANLTQGAYRIDAVLGDGVAWRAFLTLVD